MTVIITYICLSKILNSILIVLVSRISRVSRMSCQQWMFLQTVDTTTVDVLHDQSQHGCQTGEPGNFFIHCWPIKPEVFWRRAGDLHLWSWKPNLDVFSPWQSVSVTINLRIYLRFYNIFLIIGISVFFLTDRHMKVYYKVTKVARCQIQKSTRVNVLSYIVIIATLLLLICEGLITLVTLIFFLN